MGAIASAQVAISEEFSIPPYRQNKAAINSFVLPLRVDGILDRFSRLSGEPFGRIDLNVSAHDLITPADQYATKVLVARLEEFALRAVQSRLTELDVSDVIQVSFFDPGNLLFRGSTVGETSCGAMDIEFRFAGQEQDLADRRVTVLAGTVLISQQPTVPGAGGTRRCVEFGPAWIVHAAPLIEILEGATPAKIEAGARAQILRFVDFEVVPQILQSRKVASEKLRSWIEDGN